MRLRLNQRTRILMPAIAALVTAIMASPALAADVSIAVGAPSQVTIGQNVEVKAVLTEAGNPLEGAEIALTYTSTFGGRLGTIELAAATTDATGTAVMVYQQRADENGEMQVAYLGPDEIQVEPYTFSIAVDTTDASQLYTNQSGVKIPFLNGTLFLILVLGLWLLIAAATVYLVRVGVAGQVAESIPTPSAIMTGEDGSIRFAVLLSAVTIITAIGMGIVIVRAPVSNQDVTDPDVYDRTEIAHVDTRLAYEGLGLNDPALADTGDALVDGRNLFIGSGCAGCHGVAGNGAIVGPALVDETGSFGGFQEDVREGPRGMPLYDVRTLSELDLRKIYDFIKQSE